MNESIKTETIEFFATAPKGIPPLLVEELKTFGASGVKETLAGASFKGDLETAYRACLWSRLANRILMPIANIAAGDPDELYLGVQSIPWEDHLEPDGSLAVNFTSTRSKITHTHYGALKVKDAIVDRFSGKYGVRPSVALKNPDIRIHVYLLRNKATVSLDLSGESLHMRGYRKDGREAPLKENLAAAILIRAGWFEVVRAGGGLIDPMCGSGTIPIEAALMAADVAPGRLRRYFGFFNWKGHQEEIWKKLVQEAEQRAIAGMEILTPIIGYDSDRKAVRAAHSNLERAGLEGRVHFERRELADLKPHPAIGSRSGIVVVNPPYGERMGDRKAIGELYESLGQRLRNHFKGWKASVLLTEETDPGKRIGIRARKIHTFYNGAIKCKLLNFDVEPERYFDPDQTALSRPTGPRLNPNTRPEIRMFENRIRKNLRRLKNRLKRENIHCYRLYDRDLPEYAVAIDRYEDFLHVQEYEAPRSVDPRKAKERLNDILVKLPEILEIPKNQVFLKVRSHQRGDSQYPKLGSERVFHQVREGGLKFLVNFVDYLDTGLFLDHRTTRQIIGEMVRGKSFLNLFSYTGTATVYAAKGGAKSTVSVDTSETYLDWARRNLALNGYAEYRHTFVQADCLSWMDAENRKYDVIYLDPPTFSNSKKLKRDFEVQRDHVELIRRAVRLLDKNGVLIFANNFRRFRLDSAALNHLKIVDMTRETLPFDFYRSPGIHHCWEIMRKHTTVTHRAERVP
jgi:23S rRNA (guanine2445-N2)-methyltransferase / 23S rRNA (guanine2069-N7)-methyltransferase